MPPKRKQCRWCGCRRPAFDVAFVTWECSRDDCAARAKYRELNALGAHHHAMWVCSECRQLSLLPEA